MGQSRVPAGLATVRHFPLSLSFRRPNDRPGRTFLDPYRPPGQKHRAASAAPQAGQARTTTPARGCLAELHPQPAHASLPRAAQNDHYGMVRHDIGGNPTADHNGGYRTSSDAQGKLRRVTGGMVAPRRRSPIPCLVHWTEPSGYLRAEQLVRTRWTPAQACGRPGRGLLVYPMTVSITPAGVLAFISPLGVRWVSARPVLGGGFVASSGSCLSGSRG